MRRASRVVIIDGLHRHDSRAYRQIDRRASRGIGYANLSGRCFERCANQSAYLTRQVCRRTERLIGEGGDNRGHIFQKSCKWGEKIPLYQLETLCTAAAPPKTYCIVNAFALPVRSAARRHLNGGAITYLRAAGPIGSKSPVATGARGV